MSRRRLIALLAGFAFVLSIWLANWLVQHVGPIRVWPTHLLAPAGVYVVGLAFLLRDTVQRLAPRGNLVALGLICLGVGATYLWVSPLLAGASASAFAASEVAGLAIFWTAQRWSLAGAVAGSSVAAAALDSFVFLGMAQRNGAIPHALAFFDGQLVAKLSVTLLALPLVLAARRWLPTAPTAAVASEA